MTLLSAEPWDLTLRSGDKVLTGTVRNADDADPLTKAMWLTVAAKAALTKILPAVVIETPLDGDRPPSAAKGQTPADGNAPPGTSSAPSPAGSPLSAATSAPRAVLQFLWELNVGSASYGEPNEKHQEKTDCLRLVLGVERLVGVHCCYDPAWSLQLLRSAAPSVEQLSVWYLRQAHMLAVHAMPRLRRLWLSHYMEPRSLELGELPQQGNGEGLEWLKVYGLPRPTTRSVLQAHAHSLQELVLFVGTAGEQQWPRSCSDLHSLLEQCGLRALRRVVLERGGASSRCSHGRAGCDQQRGEVRRVLHGAEVLCSKCHHRRARPYCRL
ncbi:uncharacterized protein LOC113213386 isoform X3 [Frankliniella occidentalis]|nr:uncharacterized protein LOC113213386 isoform X3 [Frankliniella occidentalis]